MPRPLPFDRPSARESDHPPVRPEPSEYPTVRPSDRPTVRPSVRPSVHPTVRPSDRPTVRPSDRPSVRPTVRPSHHPTVRPSDRPTVRPSDRPTVRHGIQLFAILFLYLNSKCCWHDFYLRYLLNKVYNFRVILTCSHVWMTHWLIGAPELITCVLHCSATLAKQYKR